MTEARRLRLESDEDARLAPWALRASAATRRHAVEDHGRAFDYRTHFQRDRDRIVFSRAFRRLRQKGQQGILPAYEDHRRNRLTHTLEVAQLARTIGRALRLNEDLVEAVALGHDLGQPPFGPAGLRALDDLLRGRLDGRGGAGLGDLGGLGAGWQALRVADLLEKRYDHPGLNLTDDVREGLLYTDPAGARPPRPPPGLPAGRAPAFETQVVALADRIAGALHDLDDALQSGTVDVARVERLRAVAELRRKLGRGYRPRAGRFVKANAIHRGLVHLLVTGTILASERRLAAWGERHGVRDAERFRAVREEAVAGDEIGQPAAARALLDDLEGFLESHARRGREADRVEALGRRVLLGLFAAYQSEPILLEDHCLLRYKQIAGVAFLRDVPRESLEAEMDRHYRRDPRFVRVLADFLAGMTDTYALAEHERLMASGAIPIPGAERLRSERGDAGRGAGRGRRDGPRPG